MIFSTETVFDWLVRISLEGSLLILVVLGLRALFGRHLGPRWRVALWTLVGLKLLLPASLSFLPGIGEWLRFESDQAPVVPVAEATEIDWSMTAPLDTELAAQPAPASGPAISLQTLLIAFWLLGAAVMISVMTLRQWRFSRQASRNRCLDPELRATIRSAAREVGLRRPVTAVLAPAGTTPAVFGVFRPRLLVPEDWRSRFDAAGLRHILLHELEHVRFGDVMWNWAAALLNALHWFNPLAWLARSRFQSDRELRCDAGTLARLPADDRIAYGRTLLDVQENLNAAPAVAGLAPCVRQHSTLRQRIAMITQPTTRKTWLNVLLLAAVAVLFCFSFGAAQADGERDGARDGDQPREGARDGDQPRREGERDGDRPREGARDGDQPRREGERDGDRPREGARDGDQPRREGERDGDRPREGARDGDQPRREGERDGDRPREGARDGDAPREGARDGDRPRDGDQPRREGEREGARDGDMRRGGDDADDPNAIHLRVERDGVILGDRKYRSMDDFRAALAKMEGDSVVLTARGEVPYSTVKAVVDAIAGQGINDVKFRAEGGDGREGAMRDGDAPREGARDGDRPREGARDGDRPREGARDGDQPRREGERDGDRPREGARDGDQPRREGERDGDRPREGARDGDRPSREGARDGDAPRGESREGARDGDSSRESSAVMDRLHAQLTRIYAAYDKNGDKKVSFEEWLAMKNGEMPRDRREREKGWFDQADANGDEGMTLEEWISWKKSQDTRDVDR